MTEKGILFNTWSVHRILAGTKTATRRNNRRPPRYKVGDVLWLRETYACRIDVDPITDLAKARQYLHYKATYLGDLSEATHLGDLSNEWHVYTHWQPGLFMPKWATRPQRYVVTAVYEQRLGDMTEDDAKREGAADMAEFRHVWMCIHDRWDPNKIVWVYQFEEKGVCIT